MVLENNYLKIKYKTFLRHIIKHNEFGGGGWLGGGGGYEALLKNIKLGGGGGRQL